VEPREKADDAWVAAAQSDPPAEARPRPPTRRWIALLLALLASPVLAEVALRGLLFSDRPWLVDLARRYDLRRPEIFADTACDDYWRLARLFEPDAEKRYLAPQVYDPLLGWRAPSILADYDHARRERVGALRPLLLYGASFCEKGFDEVFAGSELAATYYPVNYCVGGFGPDQVWLLMRESLDRFVPLRPVVAIGLELNGDFDRAALSLSYGPKPRSSVGPDGRLVCGGAPVPTTAEYLERHPPAIPSYLLRALSRGTSSAAGRIAVQRLSQEPLFAAVVRAIDDELERRGIPYFYVLFSDQYDSEVEGPTAWEEPFLRRLLDLEGIPYELSRPVVRRAAEANGERIEDYFFQLPHPRPNHPTPRGLEVMLDCWRAGLARL
jgi:hypothetical protein